MSLETLTFRTGTLRIPFEQNARIAIENCWAGRPLFEGQLPAVDVPDPNGLPEWVTFTFEK